MRTRCGRHCVYSLKLPVSLTLFGVLLIGGMALSAEASQLGRIDVTPAEVTLNLSEKQQFEANGFDLSGNEMPVQATWSATGGSIDSQTGLYTATTAGDFTVAASVAGSTVTGTASVHVTPPELTRVDVTPPEVTLSVNDQQQFHAKGYDAQGNEIPITPSWSASGGTIVPSGESCTFAATTAGTHQITCRDSSSGISGSAGIRITDDTLASVEVTPSSVSMQVGDPPATFNATGKNSAGQAVPIPNPIWETTGGGTIAPSGQSCTFAATTAGTCQITCRDSSSGISGSAGIHTTEPPPLMQTHEHPNIGTVCYPLGWTIASVGPDHLFVTDPTGQMYAGYRLWEPGMGANPQDFINSYYAQKPEGTVVDEAISATLCDSSALSTTLRYPWGTIEIITVTMLGNRPVKLFVEGPAEKVAEFVATSYYARMTGCCQLP
jgi:hypothetical protein